MGDMKELLQQRHEARRNKDYVLADKLKKRIENQGYMVRDKRFRGEPYSLALGYDWERKAYDWKKERYRTD